MKNSCKKCNGGNIFHTDHGKIGYVVWWLQYHSEENDCNVTIMGGGGEKVEKSLPIYPFLVIVDNEN